MPSSRRHFCATAALALASARLDSQPPSSRPNVAALDHDRILAAAEAAVLVPPDANSYTAFALRTLSRQVAALAAAFHINRGQAGTDRYVTAAAALLRIQLPAPYAATASTFEQVLDTLPLAEIAVSIPFLALTADDRTALQSWFKAHLDWLTTSRTAGLARDQKDHHGLSWLLQAAAAARFTANDAALRDLIHHFKTVTLRANLVADGTFPHELSTPYPYRYSLFALDLLAACCQLLSSPFESLWTFELQDGPGLQTAVARHVPYILKRSAWPYRADLDHFTDLPLRRSSLLFAARAYTRPEYAALWQSLPPDTTIPELDATLPLSQPLLWTTRP